MEGKDRWLTDGDCSKCRRANYCTKDCKAFKKRKSAIIDKALQDILAKKVQDK